MKKILECFKNSWLNLENENELRIFRKFAMRGKLLIIFLSGNIHIILS